MTPGSILCEQAYAQGKMFDNSGWYGILPRQITPSDVDWAIGNRGDVLFAEWSSQHCKWQELEWGQRTLYEEIIQGKTNISILVKHSVPPDKQIDTYEDVDSFHIMLPGGYLYPEPLPGYFWKRFVSEWMLDPKGVFNRVKGQIVPNHFF